MKSPVLRRAVVLSSLAFALGACSSGPTPATDAATDTGRALDVAASDVPAGDGGVMCTTNATCDDGLYCDGTEQCAPGTAGADARGCVHGTPPCNAATQMCSEAMHACAPLVCTHMSTPDQDGDGHADIACGGDDCADMDPHRFPGNPEVCLVGTASDGSLTRTGAAMVMGVAMTLDPTHDEDCDPATFASGSSHDGDHDMDGYVDHTCSNVDRNGMVNQGTDCQDLLVVPGVPATLMTNVAPGNIHPMQPEVCDGVDNNCNGAVDEGVQLQFYPDCDGDGYGDLAATPMPGCGPTQFASCSGHAPVMDHGDCNDHVSTIHPGATEICDAPVGAAPPVDENCNGMANEGCMCTGTVGPACCAGRGNQPCIGGTLGTCTVAPSPEVCNGVDDNCNGVVDDGIAPMACYDGAPATRGVGTCHDGLSSCTSGRAACGGEQLPSTEVCDGRDNDCDGHVDDGAGFVCTQSSSRPWHSCGFAGTQTCGATCTSWSPTISGTPTSFGPWNGNSPSTYHGCGGGYACGPGMTHWCWYWATPAAAPLAGCVIMGGPNMTLPSGDGYTATAALYVTGSATVTIEGRVNTSPYMSLGSSAPRTLTAPTLLTTDPFSISACAPFEVVIVLMSVASTGGGSIELVGASASRTSAPATAD